MRLILHIGTPKTATTYLQDTLANNPDWLASLGLFHPDLLTGSLTNHITLFYAAANYIHPFARDYGIHTEDDRIAFRTKLEKHIQRRVRHASSKIDTFIFSSENLSANMGRPGVFSLKELLTPIFDEITVISYIRRQDDGLLSMYAEHMRQGFSHGGFSEFITKTQINPEITQYADYNKLLTHWADAFGPSNLIVRRFEPSEFQGNLGILTDFIALIKGQTIAAPDSVVEVKDSNVSLSAPILKYLSLLNKDLPFARAGVPCAKRRQILNVLNHLPVSAKPTMDAAQSEKIMSYFAASNEEVRKTWFAKDALLFSPAKSIAERSNLDDLTAEEATGFSAQILNSVLF